MCFGEGCYRWGGQGRSVWGGNIWAKIQTKQRSQPWGDLVEGTASAKALRQEQALCVWRAERRPVWSEQSKYVGEGGESQSGESDNLGDSRPPGGVWTLFKVSLETREQFQARTMKRPDLYPKRISWAAFMALCHHVQPKPSEAGIVIVPVLQIRLTPWIPNLLSNRTGTCLQDGLLQSHPFLPMPLSPQGCNSDCLDHHHLAVQRFLCVEYQESKGVWHEPIQAWFQSAERLNNLQTLIVYGMMNRGKCPITPLLRQKT